VAPDQEGKLPAANVRSIRVLNGEANDHSSSGGTAEAAKAAKEAKSAGM
jgi:hypothetical protein